MIGLHGVHGVLLLSVVRGVTGGTLRRTV
ncbi:hypothetical protein FRAHR75_770009 [Frankia sp. Hr75.2]|nr:hypothetical protein FRAHR75_770009 [Frankia sp. Hr75.2]